MNRDKTTIMAEILAFCTQASVKTKVMYKTNLSYNQLQAYLSLLTSLGLLEHHSVEYVTTGKGRTFLREYAQLESLLNSSGPNYILAEVPTTKFAKAVML